MAKKIVSVGLTYELLRRRSALLSKEGFVQMLKEKHLSKQCCDKLVAFFLNPLIFMNYQNSAGYSEFDEPISAHV